MNSTTKTILISSSLFVLGGVAILLITKNKKRKREMEKTLLMLDCKKKGGTFDNGVCTIKQNVEAIKGSQAYYDATIKKNVNVLTDLGANPEWQTTKSLAKAFTNLALGIQKK